MDVGRSEGLSDAEWTSFEVRGVPAPQGSARGFVVDGNVHITSANRGLAAWRRLVSDVAQHHAPSSLWEGPLAVTLAFRVPGPKRAPKLRRTWPERRPDLDKLCRACLDSLTGIVWRDDSQVVRLEAEKDYGAPGVIVGVERVTQEHRQSAEEEGTAHFARTGARHLPEKGTGRAVLWAGPPLRVRSNGRAAPTGCLLRFDRATPTCGGRLGSAGDAAPGPGVRHARRPRLGPGRASDTRGGGRSDTPRGRSKGSPSSPAACASRPCWPPRQ